MLDTGGTPTFIKKHFFDQIKNAPNDYVFESFVLFKARQLKLRIDRPKVLYGNRMFGKSHWQRGLNAELNLLKDIVQQSRTWQ